MAARLDLAGLRVRLTLLFAAVLTSALLSFGGAVYLAAVAAEAAEDEPAAEKERELAIVKRRLALALFAALPVALLASLSGAHLLSRHALSTVQRVIRTANALSLERLDQRIASDRRAGSELTGLVDALNGMLDRLERSAGGLRRFIADASHELRTPLAVLSSDIEICLRHPREPAALRAALESTLEGLGRLGQLVEILLTLARSDAGALPVERKEVDLDALLAQIATFYEGVTAERQLRLVVVANRGSNKRADQVLKTDPLLLGRAVANLLDNACKFTLPGGMVTIETQHGLRGVAIAVTDTGPGMSAEELERACQRFYRGVRCRGSTEGFGLGLALCREFVTALGGTLELHSREHVGTIAVLRLAYAV